MLPQLLLPQYPPQVGQVQGRALIPVPLGGTVAVWAARILSIASPLETAQLLPSYIPASSPTQLHHISTTSPPHPGHHVPAKLGSRALRQCQSLLGYLFWALVLLIN